MQITLEDHSDKVLAAMESACAAALETCGLAAENYAKKLCPVAEENGGTLRNSISHTVDMAEKAAFVGTNVEYAAYVELGTGIYYEGEGGRHTAWTYKDHKGNYHLVHGQRAKPYIKPAVADHAAQYTRIIEQELKGK